ncbi:hypothetical protein [Lentibacillus sp. Marseille-P4043]|uniref:hypothetical protein n=1 Tax=Lentibacillus sp. Marseille-P4043 TaxID=2040293 RepID=UPI00131A5718|nr:hypothetical protein [Lentibacillus sp. Marseille-P4043]
MLYKNLDEFEKKQAEVVRCLNNEGINVRRGKKEPINRKYSGILSYEGKMLNINIPE